MNNYLDFEKPIAILEAKVRELDSLMSKGSPVDLHEDIEHLRAKIRITQQELYRKLEPWQKTQIARHPDRPHCLNYINAMITDFMPLCGDRQFGEDAALISGIGRLGGRSVMVIGHEKGHDLDTRMRHNFGMGKPEGYRKATRLMELAGRFRLPVITLVDTSGAYPGIEAEERGQAAAIAEATQACLELSTPLVSVIIGEGGSGGAVSLATADSVYMLEYSVYSVISPEGCASILWRDAGKASLAAQALKITAQDLLKFGIIDGIIPEPCGGAHRDASTVINAVSERISQELHNLCSFLPEELIERRYKKYMAFSGA